MLKFSKMNKAIITLLISKDRKLKLSTVNPENLFIMIKTNML
jgi:hypothetical protein